MYLGAAPGVGKTFKMLEEGHRRAERGSDVVLAYLETHGRAATAKMAEGLELIPRATREYRGIDFPGDGHRRGARPAPADGPGR